MRTLVAGRTLENNWNDLSSTVSPLARYAVSDGNFVLGCLRQLEANST